MRVIFGGLLDKIGENLNRGDSDRICLRICIRFIWVLLFGCARGGQEADSHKAGYLFKDWIHGLRLKIVILFETVSHSSV